jgi:ribosomal protein L14
LSKRKVSIGQVFKAVIISTRNPKNRSSGFVLKHNKGSVVLVDREKLVPLGTRINAGVPNEIRVRGQIKILALAKGLI